MHRPRAGLSDLETWFAWIRLAAVAFALLEVGVFTKTYPLGYEQAGWIVTAVFAIGAATFFWIAQREGGNVPPGFGLAALVFDTAIVSAYSTIFTYDYGNQTRWALILIVAEGALRYGLRGGIAVPLALIPYIAFNEWYRGHEFGPPGFLLDRVTFPSGVMFFTGLIFGWLVRHLEEETSISGERAAEAERLRDELAQRADVLESANRAARALASSLELDAAFGAFIRELRGLVPFERAAIVLVEGDTVTTMATAGRGADTIFPPGSSGPLAGSVLEKVVEAEIVLRRNLEERGYEGDDLLVELGLRSEVVAPLMLGARTIGMLSVSRAAADAFSNDEVELVALLGRLVATAVQNIRAYEAERRRVEELARLSALRADFVSLVSHELRSPMAAVIGASRTLQERWRLLSAEQRESFLALIADETTRLAELVADVLDTSRLEAGTFSYRFEDIDLAGLVGDAVEAAMLTQQDVKVVASVPGTLPTIRGDRARLRQVLGNLIDNAVKYSPDGGQVDVRAFVADGGVRISVRDAGPGIPREQHARIFEKFGRVDIPGSSKPGTGLGLFIARSIAEAHGGTLEVSSLPGEGATFVLTLPAAG
ncbi:MAG: two-component system, OmpR family, sensor histidine kinase KdpD [Gaiellaceae bacterium]|jgi:signal transduction histidine kinase|nr:two-component system, OmpR family, sensor histidine kinase KdpD [Gaiellaceae bacterium]